MEYIKIDNNNKTTILELFNKETDAEGFIIEKRTKKRLVCPYTRENIHSTSFSILPGTATFVNNTFHSFAQHLATHIEQIT